jgi:large subunit ribosomal protein L9
MKVILLESVRGFGKFADIVNVKPGFARNFLIPMKKAIFATKPNLASFEERRVELEKVAAEKMQLAKARAEKLTALSGITLTAQANTEGKLFGSVGIRDIVKAIQAQGIEVEKSEIVLSSGAIQQVGEYEADFLLHSEVALKMKVIVASL